MPLLKTETVTIRGSKEVEHLLNTASEPERRLITPTLEFLIHDYTRQNGPSASPNRETSILAKSTLARKKGTGHGQDLA